MQTTQAIRERAAQLLASDTTTLAQAVSANKVALVKSVFTESELIAIGDLTLADFDGSTPVDVGLGTQPEGLDPLTADSIISLKPPAAGFRWETTGLTNLPQTIYGFALLDNAMGTVLASQRLTTPVTLTAANQVLILNPPSIRQLANSML